MVIAPIQGLKAHTIKFPVLHTGLSHFAPLGLTTEHTKVLMEPTLNNSTPATDDRPMFGETSRPPFPNPFVGLRPFRTEESLLFFGRNEQTIELLQQLHRTRFLAVVGSSGCGKSSLIRAGLIPKLKAGFLLEDRDRWLTATMKPGDSPLRHLATAMLEAVFGDTTEAMLDDFVKNVRQLGAEYITTRLAVKLGDSSSNLLLLIDQFEEIFRFGVESNNSDQREEAEDFVSLMLALAEQRTLPIYVVMTMRSDFIGDCDNFYGLPDAMNRSQYLVPRLTRQQRQQAIEGPIRLFGASIAPRLLDRVLNDAGDKFDQLPVMQHALMRTFEFWQKSGDAELDINHYEAIGTITYALSRDAEAALSGMNDDEFKVTERMFRALVDTDENNRRIRRPAHLSELCATTEADRDTILQIIKRFSDPPRSFLAITEGREKDDPLIDISHESLIRQWDRMNLFVQAEVETRDLYLRLVDAAKRGREHWRGKDLIEAIFWHEVRKPNTAWARRYDSNFDQAMGFLYESQRAAEELERQKELAASETEERRKRELHRTRSFAGFVTGLLIAAALLAWWALRQQQKATEANRIATDQKDIAVSALFDAEKQRNIADSQRDQANKAKEEAEKQKALADAQALAAEMAKKDADRQKGIAVSQKELSDAFFFDASMNLAQNAFEIGNRPRGYELLNQFLDPPFDKARNLAWNYLWRENHQELNTLIGHVGIVNALSFTPDGKMLASAGIDKSIRLWDIISHKPIAILHGHDATVLSIVFSPDGKILASASGDKTIKLWNIKLQHNFSTIKLPEGVARSIAFSPDGKTLVSGGTDKVIWLWDVLSQQSLAMIKGHEAPIYSVAFSPDGKILASAGSDKTVRLWDITSRQNIATFKEHENTVLSVTFSPEGETLASASVDTTVRLWDVSTRKNIATLRGHSDFVSSIAFSPNRKILASTSGDRTINLWDLTSRQNIVTLKGHEDSVWPLVFTPDGKILASAGADHTVKLWSVDSQQSISTYDRHENPVRAVTFSPDGRIIASASDDETVRLWNARSGQNLALLKGHGSYVRSVAFAPNGKTLASTSTDETVKLWDVGSGQDIATLKGHKSSVLSVAFSTDGKILASASSDATINLWDAQSWQNLATLKGHNSTVNSVAFAPDGKTLASAGNDATVRLWDTRYGQNIATLKGHGFAVWSVAFAPDGKTLASAGSDKTVKLWDARTGQNLATFKGHKDSVRSVAFTPDGKALASAGGDSRGKKDFAIRLWRAATEADVARQRNK